MKIRKDDKVLILAGKDKGKTSKVLKVLYKENKVLVEGVNLVKRHLKPGVVDKDGGIASFEKPIHISNVMYVEEKTGKPTRLGYKVYEGKRYRFSKRTGEIIK